MLRFRVTSHRFIAQSGDDEEPMSPSEEEEEYMSDSNTRDRPTEGAGVFIPLKIVLHTASQLHGLHRIAKQTARNKK